MCRIYKGLDENQDGKVSKVELKTFLLGIQLQTNDATKDDLVEIIMDRFDISGDQSIEENEFVRILMKWLREARKSVSQNDYNPLSFFATKPSEVTFYFRKFKRIFCFLFEHILLQLARPF